MAQLAPLFDVLLSQPEPLATQDVRALLTYVLVAFEEGSPVRELVLNALQGRPREMFVSIADSLVAQGRAAGLSRAVLGVLAHRRVSIADSVRERVSSARNEDQLQRWFERAFTVASAEDIFDELEVLDGSDERDGLDG